MNTNNPIYEVGTLVLAALLVIGGVLLLYANRIDTGFATSMFILAAGLLGINGALKTPSQAQQQNLQALTSQVLNTLPQVISATQSQPVAQPVQVPIPAGHALPSDAWTAQPHVADEFTAPLVAVPKQ